MPQIINTNLASINAQRQLDITQRDSDRALERLSSGLRINGASDDAAGLAISNRITAQVRGTAVASRNAGDGVSLAQTAEGALNSMRDGLQRIRELALQSANGSNTDLERQSLQEEVDQLKAEIASISEKTSFNGRTLLDGSFNDVTFQTGANVGETITVSVGKVTEDTLGTSVTNGISSNQNLATGTTANQSITAGDLTINGVAIAAPTGSDDNASDELNASSAIAKAAAINDVSDQTGVIATVNTNTAEGTTLAAAGAVAAENLTLNGQTISIGMAGIDLKADLDGVASAINNFKDATGVEATVVETETGFRVDLSAEDGRNISLSSATSNTSAFGLAAAAATVETTYIGDFTLVSEDGSDIVIGTDTGNIDNYGFEAGTYSGSNSGVVGDNVTDNVLTAGDLTLNGVTIGASYTSDDTASTVDKAQSAISKAAAINRVSDETGVTAVVNANTAYVDVAANATAFTLTVNGEALTGGGNNDASLDFQAFIDAVNNTSGETGVRAEAVDANTVALVADDGRNIALTGAANGISAFGDTTLTDTNFGSLSLISGGDIEVSTLTGNNEYAGIAVGTYGSGEQGTLLKDLDISTVDGANAAVIAIDNAINQVSQVQAQLGAVQNRFEATISNLAVQSENLQAANSRITDADFASETAELSRTQVLQQAGISVLAQANARPQQALSLLQ